MHERPPAFGAADGHSYSVSAFADEAPDAQGRYGAALLFVRWQSTDGGPDSRPSGHLETEYLAFGATPAEALAPLLALTLEQVKQHLDDCAAKAGTRP